MELSSICDMDGSGLELSVQSLCASENNLAVLGSKPPGAGCVSLAVVGSKAISLYRNPLPVVVPGLVAIGIGVDRALLKLLGGR